jgi:UDPglucose 6-dehydrogenase
MTRPTSPSLEIAVIGAGYVGLVTGVCLAKLGFRVTCVDKNLAIISALGAQKIPFFEPGLEDFLIESTENGLLTFTDTLADAVTAADVVFVAVGTPSGDAGQADLSCVHQVVEEMALYLQEGAVVVIKSTVPVGTNRALSRKLEAICPHTVHVVSNPEFLRGCNNVFAFWPTL